MNYINDLRNYIKKKYGANPEYLWKSYPDYAVFRHADNNKWFAVIMNIEVSKLGLSGTDRVNIINLKVDDLFLLDILVKQDGYFRGYHRILGIHTP